MKQMMEGFIESQEFMETNQTLTPTKVNGVRSDFCSSDGRQRLMIVEELEFASKSLISTNGEKVSVEDGSLRRWKRQFPHHRLKPIIMHVWNEETMAMECIFSLVDKKDGGRQRRLVLPACWPAYFNLGHKACVDHGVVAFAGPNSEKTITTSSTCHVYFVETR